MTDVRGDMQASIPFELYDLDGYCVIAVRGCTRNQARAFFAREHDTPYPDVKVRRAAYRRDLDYEREQTEDGIEEPYDGWPLRECGPGEDGVKFWVCDCNA